MTDETAANGLRAAPIWRKLHDTLSTIAPGFIDAEATELIQDTCERLIRIVELQKTTRLCDEIADRIAHHLPSFILHNEQSEWATGLSMFRGWATKARNAMAAIANGKPYDEVLRPRDGETVSR